MQTREAASLTDDYLTALYDRDYFDSYGGLMRYEDYLRKHPFRRLVEILNRAAPSGSKMLLEIGCAYGGFLEECAATGWTAEGVDHAQTAIDYAARRKLRVHCGDFRAVKLDRSSYDAVVALATIEHIRDPRQFLCDAAKLVRSGGVFMLTTIDMSGLMPSLLGRRWAQTCPPWHLYYFRQPQLARYLEAAGLSPMFVGGKLLPATSLYRVAPYRAGRSLWNAGYVLFLAQKK